MGTEEQWNAIQKIHCEKNGDMNKERAMQQYRKANDIMIDMGSAIDDDQAAVLFCGSQEDWAKLDTTDIIKKIIKEEQNVHNYFAIYRITFFSLPKDTTINFEYKGK